MVSLKEYIEDKKAELKAREEEIKKQCDDLTAKVQEWLSGIDDRDFTVDLREEMVYAEKVPRSTDLSTDNSAKTKTCRFFSNMIASENDRLLYLSDVFFHPTQMKRPDWHSVIDLNPKQLEATRRKLLDRAASVNALVLAFHFPFPGLGHVVREKLQWEWRPLESTV